MPIHPEVTLARALRKAMTGVERRLWSHLRRRRRRFRFRRQVPIGPYIVDFACLSQRLVIEIDGPTHDDESEAADQRRQRWLEANGFRVLRFSDEDVFWTLEGVLEVIDAVLDGAG